MATGKRTTFNKFIKLLEDMEEEFFEPDTREMYFHGVKYTKGEFQNYKTALRRTIQRYEDFTKNSGTYLKRNADYNRLMRKIGYYKAKKNKTPNDFKQLEILQKEHDKWLKKKEEERIEKKREQLDTLIERQKKKYENQYQDIDDNFDLF